MKSLCWWYLKLWKSAMLLVVHTITCYSELQTHITNCTFVLPFSISYQTEAFNLCLSLFLSSLSFFGTSLSLFSEFSLFLRSFSLYQWETIMIERLQLPRKISQPLLSLDNRKSPRGAKIILCLSEYFDFLVSLHYFFFFHLLLLGSCAHTFCPHEIQ